MDYKYCFNRSVVLVVLLCCFFSLTCSSTPDNTDNNLSELDKIINRIIDKSGGENAIMSVKNLDINGTFFIYAKTGIEDVPMSMVFNYPDKALMKFQTGASDIISVINGTKSRLRAFSMDQPLPEQDALEMKHRLIQNIIWIVQKYRNGIIDIKQNGSDQTSDQTELSFTFEEIPVKMVINSKTWLPEQYIITENNIINRLILSDYRDVRGLNLPFGYENQVNGRTVSKVTIDRIDYNREFDPALFEIK
ncbi:MAG: hypothetical protein GY863_25515 [bacterium]|nr:hypothetical protein [bacterium]